MFRGQFQHSVDAKGRVGVPARFRELLLPRGQTQFIVTPDPRDPCLNVFALPAWEELERKIAELPSMDPHVVRFRRVYVSAAIECELDKAGRVLVPQALRARIALGTEAVFAGMGPRIDLWALERWQDAIKEEEGEREEFHQALARFGI